MFSGLLQTPLNVIGSVSREPFAQQRAPEAPPWWEVTVDDLLGTNDDGTGGYNYTIRQGSGGTN